MVILTATSDSDLPQKAASAGAKAVLTKPCPLEMLRVGIDDALDRVIRH